MEVVIFTTKDCSPCRTMKAILTDYQEIKKFQLRVVEATRENFREFEKHGIRAAPTVICLDDEGKKVGDFTGIVSPDIAAEFLRAWGVVK